MSEFHDPELRQQLGRLSGPYPDDNAAFVAWQRRVGQVRRRRAMAWTTAAALVLIVGVVGVAALQGRQSNTRAPQKAVESSSSVSTSVDDSRAKPVTTVSTAPPATPAIIPPTQITTPTSDSGVETSVVETDGQAGLDPSGTTPESSTHKSQSGSSGTTSKTTQPTQPTQSTQQTQPTAPTTDAHDSHIVTQTIDSIGGSITVRQDRDHLTVIDVTPASGFQAHQSGHNGPGVFVTFTSAAHESDITVSVYFGKIIPKVTEQTQTHGESVPTTEPPIGGGD